MGLDISYYTGLTKRDCVFDADGEPIDPETRKPIHWDQYLRVHVNPHFHGRADELEDDGIYTYKGKRAHFHAGSYSGYGRWRDELAKLAGYPSAADPDRFHKEPRHDSGAFNATSGPFWELINFSDCEGTIGPKTSAKLAKDFEEFQGKADQHPDDYFRDLYSEWRRAFETASNNGAVSFH